jgi:hypothetical protein
MLPEFSSLPKEVKEKIFGYLTLEIAVELLFLVKEDGMRRFAKVENKYCYHAISTANKPLLQWLIRMNYKWDIKSIDCAAEFGQLDILKFLEIEKPNEASDSAMDRAAQNGHLEIVKYLHIHREEGCSHSALDLASKNGHIEIVKLLCLWGKGCIYAMKWAAKNNHIQVIQTLKDNFMINANEILSESEESEY